MTTSQSTFPASSSFVRAARLLLVTLVAARLGTGIAAACTTDAECSDGNGCNGIETCVASVCQPGTPLNCQDVNPCSVDSCDPTLGVCRHVALPDGSSCGGTICTGLAVCMGGLCKPGTGLDCNDGIVCTADTCDPVTGCQHTPIPNGGACSDGDPCNGTETCQAGVCTPGTPPTCDDGNACTQDSCVTPAGCQHTPVANGIPCSDGNACNGAETCQAGVCSPGSPLNCNDNNPCTIDGCNPTTACTHVPGVDGTSCSDGRLCNGVEQCLAGICRPGIPAPDGTPCPDQDLCNGTEVCKTGACVAGPPLDCGDGDACTTDGCTGAGVCTHAPFVCDDGNPDTTDACDASAGCKFDAPLPGQLLSLKANPLSAVATKVRLVVRKAPTLMASPVAGGSNDPILGGGSLRIVSAALGFDRTYPLPASHWTYVGSATRPVGFQYNDRHQAAGPFTKVLLRGGGSLIAVARGPGLTLTLPGVPAPVDVVVSLGRTRYCLTFGGQTGFRLNRAFTAKSAPAPAACP